jgi:hypothetical protein
MSELDQNNQNDITNIGDDNMLPSIIICDCGSPEHQLLIYKDNDFSNDYREVIIVPHLNTYHNFFKRLWIGFKYAFGYKCRYGHWDSIVITTNNYKPLKDAVNFLENGN